MTARFFNLLISTLFVVKMLLLPGEAHAQSAPTADFGASDTSICPEVSLDFFDLSTNGPTSYQWIFIGAETDTSSVANPTGIVYRFPGAYTVTLIVSNQYGSDTLTKAYYIQVKGSFFISPDTNVYAGAPVTLYASGGSTYLWSPGGSVFASIDVTPTVTTTYHCTIFDSVTSCTAHASVTVWILYDFLFVANTFHPTPDYPQIAVHAGKNMLQAVHWSIYDRWGEKVFESTDIDMGENLTGWDGTFQGKPCSKGVYVYTLSATFVDDAKWIKNGNITLIR